MGEKPIRGEQMTARAALEAEADFQRQDLLKRTGRAPTQEEMERQLRKAMVETEKRQQR